MFLRRSVPLRLFVGVFAAAFAGCAGYEPAPFDAARHDAEWANRSPDSTQSRDLAARLAPAGESPPPFDPGDGLSLAEGEIVALLFHPDLRLARLDAAIAGAESKHAGLWPDPVLGVDFEQLLDAAGKPWAVIPTLSFTLPISGRLAAERLRADESRRVELARVAAAEWRVRVELREKWLAWSAQRDRDAAAREWIESLSSLERLASRFEEAGELDRVSARLLRIELMAQRIDAELASARATELELEVRGLLGLRPDAPFVLVPEALRGCDDIGTTEAEAVLARRNPELLVLRARLAEADAALRVEIRGQYPDLTLAPGYQDETDDSRWLLGVTLPLPIWNRNRLAVARAVAERDRALEAIAASRERLVNELARSRIAFDAAIHASRRIENAVMPLAEEQAADAERIAELGDFDVLLQLESAKSRHAARLRLIDARATETLAAIRIEDLLGPPEFDPATHEGEAP